MKYPWIGPLLGAALAVTGCGGDGGSDAPDGAAAMVNGEPIAMGDVEKVATNFIKQGLEPDSTAEGSTFAERMYYTATERLVEQALVMQQVREDGHEPSDEAVNERIQELEGQMGGPEALDNILAQQDISRDDLHRDMRINLSMQHFYEHVQSEVPEPDDAACREYFEANQAQFAPQRQVRARHIIFMTQGKSEAEAAAAKEKADKALSRAKAGEDFAALATELSEGPSAPQGGDLGFFTQPEMVPPFAEAAFATEPGTIHAEVVQTQFGYHVIKVEEQREYPQFEDVLPTIRQQLKNETTQEQFKAAIDELRQDASISVSPPTEAVLDSVSAAAGSTG